jgi:hypothetical protein
MPTSQSPPGSPGNLSSAESTSGSVKSTQPTTPLMSSVAAARLRKSSVSGTEGRHCTSTVACSERPKTPPAAASARFVISKDRRSGSKPSSDNQGCGRTFRSQTW